MAMTWRPAPSHLGHLHLLSEESDGDDLAARRSDDAGQEDSRNDEEGPVEGSGDQPQCHKGAGHHDADVTAKR